MQPLANIGRYETEALLQHVEQELDPALGDSLGLSLGKPLLAPFAIGRAENGAIFRTGDQCSPAWQELSGEGRKIGLPAQPAEIRGVDIRPDGSAFLTAGKDGSVLLWERRVDWKPAIGIGC